MFLSDERTARFLSFLASVHNIWTTIENCPVNTTEPSDQIQVIHLVMEKRIRYWNFWPYDAQNHNSQPPGIPKVNRPHHLGTMNVRNICAAPSCRMWSETFDLLCMLEERSEDRQSHSDLSSRDHGCPFATLSLTLVWCRVRCWFRCSLHNKQN